MTEQQHKGPDAAMTSGDYLALLEVMIEILDKALSLMSEEAIAALAQDMGLPMAVFPIADSDQLDGSCAASRVAGLASHLALIDPEGSC